MKRLIFNASARWIIMDATGKNELGSVSFATFDLSNGSFGFQYLGSVTVK